MVSSQWLNPPDAEGVYSAFYPSKSKLRDEMTFEFRCVQPWQRVVIRNTGEVCPCCAMFSNDLALGNVRDHTVAELWNGPVMRELRALHKAGQYAKNATCLKCVQSIIKPNMQQRPAAPVAPARSSPSFLRGAAQRPSHAKTSTLWAGSRSCGGRWISAVGRPRLMRCTSQLMTRRLRASPERAELTWSSGRQQSAAIPPVQKTR